MSTMYLYFDESGYTGSNLLDPDQPFFVIASTNIDDKNSERILKNSFPNYKGEEFKFTKIWSSENNSAGLKEFANQIKEVQDKVFVWIMDKKFIVLTKMVDMLIEPVMHDAGYDFYADGFCWKYTNYIHYGISNFESKEFYDELLKSYLEFSRDPNPESLTIIQRKLTLMSKNCNQRVKIFLEQMAMGAQFFLNYHRWDEFKKSNEVQVTSLIGSIVHWRQRFQEDFAVIHDNTANFFRRADLWEKITGSDVPKQTHILGDGSSVDYPLRVVSTNPVNSVLSHSVQLCDVIAGFVAKTLDTKVVGNRRLLIENVIEAGFSNIIYNGVRPGTQFPDRIPPKKLDGPDVVDQMTNIIFRDRS